MTNLGALVKDCSTKHWNCHGQHSHISLSLHSISNSVVTETCDSPESPLYQPNLTPEQRIQKLILLSNLSKHLRKEFQAKHNNSNVNVLRPIVDHQLGSAYIAKIGIGTFRRASPISCFLRMDTRSVNMSWFLVS